MITKKDKFYMVALIVVMVLMVTAGFAFHVWSCVKVGAAVDQPWYVVMLTAWLFK